MADHARIPRPHVHRTAHSISGLPARGRVLCRGHIESVTYPSAESTSYFTAVVSDSDAPAGAGRPRLKVVWIGRRRIPGIAAGVEVQLEGMLARNQGMPTMFNPRYELLSRQEKS
ncbi:hypothetical protein [Pseudarthrobacter sp. PS3-L1]|uniref:hypothetical protein n=1 Tax=Pseudarthrobacter sp. PS3-L1 TaxID=3046207 RepID=UPI0024B8C474|nr:hypothetical protein [Pseudarthrobacter sp. PS3-L1]MDJ0320323.1 hypothetical protein [Pseudarthrobacter sp. PS3-L1]